MKRKQIDENEDVRRYNEREEEKDIIKQNKREE